MIAKWWQARKKARDVKRFNEGYEWGAGWLVRGESLEDLLAYTCGSFGPDEFDRGAMQALVDFSQWLQSHEHQLAFLEELKAAY